jgi:hypothetical protein
MLVKSRVSALFVFGDFPRYQKSTKPNFRKEKHP